jgi:hypothetical protein
MTTTHASGNITALRGDINREAASRVWDVGGALRVHLNNMSLGGLREYIALSRHQFELTEFVCERTGQSGQSGGGDNGPETVPVMNYHLGRHELVPFKRRGIEALPPTPGWELEMLDDMAWRARAIGAVLHRLGPQIPVRTADDHAELSRHQCEIVDFMTTGSFRKVPKRRKARTLSGGGVTPESEERIKLLGEALQEYQGRIEIKTVREFIALSKHQCELAGLLFESVSGEGKEPVFEVVHYGEAYGLNGSFNHRATEYTEKKTHEKPLFGKVVGDSYREGFGEISSVVESAAKSPLVPLSKGGDTNPSYLRRQASSVVACEKQESLDSRLRGNDDEEQVHSAGSGLRPEPHISDRQQVHGSGTAVHGQRFSDREISGSSCKLEPAKVNNSVGSRSPQFEAVRLDPNTPDNLPRSELRPDGKVPVPVDGRWVRVETPDGPLAMRRINPSGPSGPPGPPPEPVWFDDVWEDDYWNENWGDDP